MGHTALVSLDIAAGKQLIAALDKAGITVSVGLWAVFPEFGEGRVVLASPELDALGKREAYVRVAEIFNADPPQMLPSLTILRMDDPLIRALREKSGAARPASGLRLGGQSIGGRFIDDAYVYKIQ